MMQLLGFSTLPQIPNNTTRERPPVTTTVFAATAPENTLFAYHASTSTNPNLTISPTFLEANYDILESLLRERRRQIRNEDLRIEPEYISEDYDEEQEMKPRPKPRREATSTLQLRSPMVCRQQERVVGFEDAPNREGNRRGRNAEEMVVARSLHMFTYTLKDSARIWWNSQKTGSILNNKDLKAKFRSHFSQQKKLTKTHLAVHNIKQREGESTRAFITRYTDDTFLVDHLSIDLPSTYKGLMEKTYTWVEAREVATNGASSDRRDNFEWPKKRSWDNNRGQRNKDKFSPYRGPNHGFLPSL
ncbi:reverse transcriptase domain-containing protein [Tanacetum coccineum]